MSCSGSQTSARPPPKPNVLNPIDSRATLPVRIIRSAHEIFLPYFCLIGHSSLPALSHTSRLLETSQWNPRLSYHTRCSTMESDSSNTYFPFGAWPGQSLITATAGFSVIVPIDSERATLLDRSGPFAGVLGSEIRSLRIRANPAILAIQGSDLC